MTLRFPDLPADHPANNLDAKLLHDPNRFAAKLSYSQRCGVAASILCGFSTRHIARAFSVNRRTVTRMLAESSKQYSAIRDELNRLGKNEFIAKYFTADTAATLNNVAGDDPELAESNKARDAATGTTRTDRPNERANGHAGISLHKGSSHDHTYRIEIKWYDNPEQQIGPGWYTIQLDVEGMETSPFGDDDGLPFNTSALALKYAKKWLDDNV